MAAFAETVDPELLFRDRDGRSRGTDDGRRISAFRGWRKASEIQPPVPPPTPISTSADTRGESARKQTIRSPPPPPPRTARNDSAAAGRRRGLVRARSGDVERVYGEAVPHGGNTTGLAKSRQVLRVWIYAYEYLMNVMSADVASAIDDGILTSRPSTSQQGFYRVDAFDVSPSRANACLDRFNELYGGIIDDLVLYEVERPVADAGILDELTSRFRCLLVPDGDRTEVVCLPEDADTIDRWLMSRLTSLPSAGPEPEPEPADKRLPEPADKRLPEPANKRLPEPANKRLPEPADKRLPEPADKRLPKPADKRLPEACFLINDRFRAVVRVGDVTNVSADVIVKPANCQSGRADDLSTLIERVAGPVPIVARYNYEKKRRRLVAPAKVLVTAAGNLRCKHLLHAYFPLPRDTPMSTKLFEKYQTTVRKTFSNVLKKLDKKSIKVAILPLMADGVVDLTPSQVLTLLVRALVRYKPRHHGRRHQLLTIELVDTRQENVHTLIRLLDNEASRSEQGARTRSVQRLRTR